MKTTPTNIEKYGNNYSQDDFWEKVKRVARKAGAKVVYLALLLYYVLENESTPKADKAKIIGALGYFILPLDLIPDFTPIVGFADDLTALIWAYHSVKVNITPEIRMEAKIKLEEWFGKVADEDLKVD